MNRQPPAVTVVVPAWNAWADTAACLASLARSCRPGDQVIVVDNGSTDETPAALAAHDVTVVTNAENLGFARACNQGAERADHEIVVFLNSDTVVTPGTFDRLSAPFADPTVAATGPCSNGTNSPQRVEPDLLGYDTTDVRFDDLHRFTERWAVNAHGPAVKVGRLYGFCLAVRRVAFTGVGGFSEEFGIGGGEDDDLCIRLRAAGHQLRFVPDAYVHHAGHRTFEANGVDWVALEIEAQRRFRAKHPGHAAPPLLSACLIVKDEAHTIQRCLASVDGVVDEVVIYDTGSTDDTVAIARDLGATVVEGHWDDDFARARNASLEHCSGQWILHIDADEELRCTPAGLRQGLGGAPGELDAVLVTIDNVTDTGTSKLTHRAHRLFRRERCHWEGALHERVVRNDGADLRSERGTAVQLVHHGYAASAMADGAKTERNIRIAETAVEGAGPDDDLGVLLLNLAKSYAPAGDYDAAIAACERARTAPDTVAAHAVRRFGVEILFALGRFDEARSWIDDLETRGGRPGIVAYLRGSADLFEERPAPDMLALVDRQDVVDNDGLSVGRHQLDTRVGLALHHAGRHDEAVPRLVAALAHDPGFTAWRQLIESSHHAGAGFGPLLAAIDDTTLAPVLEATLHADAPAANAFALELVPTVGPDPRVLHFAAAHGRRLELVDAVIWGSLVRATGAAEHCPVLGIAVDGDRATLDRFSAAVVARVTWADPRAEELLDDLVDELDPADEAAASYIVAELTPAG